jgi:LmbE family N-acetylglucosaminyl deacetylase
MRIGCFFGGFAMINLILRHLVPIPKIKEMKSAIFVGPHPDDIEIGAGGTVHSLIAQGASVTYIIVTDGGCGSIDPNASVDELIKTRYQESENAAKIMGVNAVHHLDFPDCAKYAPWDVALKIAEIIAQIRPDIVFCPDPDLPSETHPDHIRTAKATRTAVMMAGIQTVLKRNGIPFDATLQKEIGPSALAYYYTHRANQFVGLNKANLKAKELAIMAHESQVSCAEPGQWKQMFQYMRLQQAGYGFRIFRKQAEGFFVMGPLHQHCFPEVNNF